MIDRTPRLLYQNYFQDADTQITALSEDPAAPIGYMRYQTPSLVYQSIPGYNVVSGLNDKMDFNRGGVQVAALTSGNYSSPQLYAAMVQGRMNAASPGFTISYAIGLDNKFSISNSIGTFTLLFGSGVNLLQSCALDLGYTETDHSPAALTWDAENPSYHTREAVQFRLSGAKLIQALAIYYHNMREGGTLEYVHGSVGEAALWAQVGAVVTGDDLTRIRIDPNLNGGDGYTDQYWMFKIKDVGNRDGFSQIGIPYGGPYWQPGRAFAVGSTRKREVLSAINRSYTGTLFRASQRSPRRHQMNWIRLTRADRLTYEAMEEVAVGRHIFFCGDPRNFPGSDTKFGMLDGPASITEQVGDGDPAVRYNITTDFVEDLG